VSYILIVDDDPAARRRLSNVFEVEGYEVREVSSGTDAVTHLANSSPELLLLDLLLPDISGLEVLRAAVEQAVPVIVAGGVRSELTGVRALQLGADDFVMEPVRPVELTARVGALLRRSRGHDGGSITINDLRIDLAARTVHVRDDMIELTPKEFDLLAFLATRPGKALTRHQLLAGVWRSSSTWQSQATVTEHIHRLRAKIEVDPSRPRIVVTVRGVGYRLERQEQPRSPAVPETG
jgi:two-component system alkaline phosphatase synthesis response regulator PhoP